VQRATLSYDIEPTNLRVWVAPNPVRANLSASKFVYELNRPGELRFQLFDVRGRRVYSSAARRVELRVLNDGPKRIDFAAGGTEIPELPSGTYVLRATWSGDQGERVTSTARMVLVR
jgi:hypothetical protein